MEPAEAQPRLRLAIDKIPSDSSKERRASARMISKPLNASDMPYTRKSSPPRVFTYEKEGVLYSRTTSLGHMTVQRAAVITPKSKQSCPTRVTVKLKEVSLIDNHKEAKKFDKEMMAYLDNRIELIQHRDITKSEIDRLAKLFCIGYIERLFTEEKRPSKIRMVDVVKCEIERAFNAWDHAIRCLDLAEPYVQRLSDLLTDLVVFINEHGKKTELAKQIYAFFSLLVDGKDLRQFLILLKSDKFDKKVSEIAKKLLGKTFHECFQAWEYWSNPTASKDMRPWVTQAYIDCMAVKLLPGTRFNVKHPTCDWKEEINKSSCYEVILCLYTRYATFKRVTFKHQDNTFDLDLSEKNTPKTFFTRFMQAMSRCGFTLLDDEFERLSAFEKIKSTLLVNSEMQALFIDLGLNRDLIEQKLGLPFVTSEELLKMHFSKKFNGATAERDFANHFIPNIHFYRRAINTPYMIANECFKDLFPGLNKYPYGSKMIQGIELDIEINNPNQYRITQTRCYGIYPRTQDSPSMYLDEKRVLAKIWISVIVDGGLEESMQLEIQKIEIPSSTTDVERWDIQKALIDVNEIPLT